MAMEPGGRMMPYGEHLFWLEILEDHAHFLHDHLAPQEENWIRQAAGYIRTFHEAVLRVKTLDPMSAADSGDMISLAQAVYPAVYGYFCLEGTIQHLRLWNGVNVDFTPSYFNGTLAENQEYLRQLGYFRRGEVPPELPLSSLLDMWLEDQLGHAVLLRGIFDPVELGLSAKADGFAEAFQAHMVKNRAMQSYQRFTPPGFPAQQQFAEDVLDTVKQFYAFVQLVVERYRRAQVLNKTTLRFLEHHFPESCYFMRKLVLFLPDVPPIMDCPLQKPSFID